MSLPENPNTIVIKNKFYSKGLREIDIWNYYQKYKGIILDQTRGRDLMFAIFVEENKPIIRRKGEGGKIIQLTNSNYDKIITGRTVTIYSTMKSYEDIAIIDIDSDNFNKAKQAASDVFESMMEAPFIRTADIRFTGKTSFHIFCKLSRKIKIDSIRFLMKQHIELKSELLINIQWNIKDDLEFLT
jgi:tRNA U38,U39,U40 pseudouridine synthase TruA